MRLRFLAAVVTVMIMVGVANAQTFGATVAPIPLVSLATVTQDFNTLAVSGSTNSGGISGFGFIETGGNANSTYAAGTGSSGTGNTYSFGTGTTTERAFGGVQSGSLIPTIYGGFANNTGSTIQGITLSYVGETWRVGTANRPDSLTFSYAVISGTDIPTVTTVNSAIYTNVPSLTYNSTQDAVIGAKNGDAAAFRATVSGDFNPTLPSGSTLLIRWSDTNAADADDGLAVDDFSLTPSFQPVPAPPAAVSLGIGLVGLAGTGLRNMRLRAAKRKAKTAA